MVVAVEEKFLRSIARIGELHASEEEIAHALRRARRRRSTDSAMARLRVAAALLGLTVEERRARPGALPQALDASRWAVVPTEDPRELRALRRSPEGTLCWLRFVEGGETSEEEIDETRLSGVLGVEEREPVRIMVIEAAPPTPVPQLLPSKPGRSPLSRLWELVAPDRTEIWIIIGFSICVGVLTLATPVAVQSLVNFVAFGGLVQPLILVGLLLFAFLALAGIIRAYKTYVVEILQRRILVRITSDLTYRLPRVRRDAQDFGPELVNRFFDVMTLQKTSALLLLDGLGLVLHTGVGLLVLAFYHPLLLVFDMILVAAMIFVLWVLGRGAVRSAISESKAKHDIAAALQEVARAPLTYKLAGASGFVNHRMDALTRAYVDKRRTHFRVVFRQVIGAVALHAVAGTALLTLGGWLVIAGQLTLGQLVAAELIVSLVLVSFSKLGKQLELYYDLLASVDKVGQLYDLPLESRGEERRLKQDAATRLELRHVQYTYPSGHRALDDFSLHVSPGERVAVYGAHGSYKSTLAELICGLRSPDQGAVQIDGVDVLDLSSQALRDDVALVAESELIQGTVLDNVQLGRRWVSTTDVRDALADLEILEDLQSVPGGLQARVSPNGGPLSHGHSQLLMYARALAGNPRLLVIDGLLDDLDTDGLERTLHAIEAHGTEMTVVVFTSRRDVAERFDRTVRLDPRRGRRHPSGDLRSGPERRDASPSSLLPSPGEEPHPRASSDPRAHLKN